MKSNNSFSKFLFSILSFFTIFSLLGSNNFSNEYKLSKNIASEISIKTNDEKILVWIDFTDKGNNADYLMSHPELYLTQKAIERRKKIRPFNSLVDYSDIPLNNNYLSGLKNAGIEIKNKSKWFNRVSCYATKDQLSQIVNYDYVKKVELVARFKKSANHEEMKKMFDLNSPDNTGNANNTDYALNYGSSLEQMEIINVPVAHDSGYMGQGVLIASFDAGFDNLSHPAFDSNGVKFPGFQCLEKHRH